MGIAADELEMRLVLSATVTGAALSGPVNLPVSLGPVSPVIVGPVTVRSHTSST